MEVTYIRYLFYFSGIDDALTIRDDSFGAKRDITENEQVPSERYRAMLHGPPIPTTRNHNMNPQDKNPRSQKPKSLCKRDVIKN